MSFDRFQKLRKRFVSFVCELSLMATQMELVQQQTRARSALTSLPRIARRISIATTLSSTPRTLHPSFRPRASDASIRTHPRRIPAPATTARILTQTRFQMPEQGSSSTVGSHISLTTISHHEHLARTYCELNTSSSGRAFCHLDSTESPPPQGLQFHEDPD